MFDEDILAEYSRREIGKGVASMWRFGMFLPTRFGSAPITAGEGWTPLRKVKSFSKNIWTKDETRNPTGTFKDRGASVAVTRLSQLKVRRLVLASEGNAGCSFALYSQMAGIHCRVYLPKQANPAKVQLTRRLGAELAQVPGTIADAGRHAANAAKATGEYNASTFVTPFRHDGKGTMALEVCEQLNWKSPDYIIYPVGGGVGLVGMWKMFNIVHRLGWIRKRPRIVAVQPYGCAPLVDAYNRGKKEVDEWQSPRTIANGLKIPKPLAGKWILKSLRESKGIALKVSDSEIRKAMWKLAGKDGMLLEPSSATGFAAVPRLYEMGLVDRGDLAVVIATGSGLKTLEQL
jgi:threonine synthase